MTQLTLDFSAKKQTKTASDEYEYEYEHEHEHYCADCGEEITDNCDYTISEDDGWICLDCDRKSQRIFASLTRHY